MIKLLFIGLVALSAKPTKLALVRTATTAELLAALDKEVGRDVGAHQECYAVIGHTNPRVRNVTVLVGDARRTVSLSCDWGAFSDAFLEGRAAALETTYGDLAVQPGPAPLVATVTTYGPKRRAYVRGSLFGTSPALPAREFLADHGRRSDDTLDIITLGGGYTELPVSPSADASIESDGDVLARLMNGVRSSSAAIAACAGAAAAQETGSVTLNVTIAADGQVSKVVISHSTLVGEQPELCIAKVVRSLKLQPSPAGRAELVSLPLVMAP